MANDIVLITGANTGLGFATVQALCGSNRTYTILLGGRSLDKAEEAAKEAQRTVKNGTTVEAIQIDIEDDESISKLEKAITEKYGRIDVLINNAGGQFDPLYMMGKMGMREMWDKSWSVNTTSTFMITHALVPLLLKSQNPRLLFITSGTSTLTWHDNQALPVNQSPPAGWPKKMLIVPAYRASKTGMNMMMAEWDRILKNDGVKMWGVSPGYLATGLGVGQEKNKEMGAIPPSEGAAVVLDVVEGGKDADVGKVVLKDKVQPW